MTSVPSPAVRVKTECPDEAEIQELATKMVEAHKLKVQGATAQSRPSQSLKIVGPVEQLGMKNSLTRRSGAPVIDKKPDGKTKSDTKASDESSLRKQFGWTQIGEVFIPYILRLSEKYCAVHMVETKILNKYLNYLHQDIYSETYIRSYYITKVESRLLNEINFKHCEGQFGKYFFTVQDLVVRLSDANEFYQFLDVCYKKLLGNSNNPEDKCGFIKINDESVPYVVRAGQTYLPLFYFESDDNITLKPDSLEGWDLSYLKFCCKVQNIRKEFYAGDTCAVISLSEIKSYFTPGTNIEVDWQYKVMNSQLLVTSRGSNPQTVGHWTRQPVGPPPRDLTTQMPQQKAVVRRAAVANQVNTQRKAHSLQNTGMTSAAVTVQALRNEQAAAVLVGGQQAGFPGLSQHQTHHVLNMAAQQQAHVQQAQIEVQAQAQAQVQDQAQAQHQQQLHQQAHAGRAITYQKAADNQAQVAARQYQQYNPNNHSASMTMLSSQQPHPLGRTTQKSNIGSGAFQQSYLLGLPKHSFIPSSIANLPTPHPTFTPECNTPSATYHILGL